MLAKKNRVNKEKEIVALVRAGQSVFGPYFSFKYKFLPKTSTKFGFVVSTKIDKRAVVRNKIQRRLRSLAKDNLVRIKDGYQILLLAKKPAATASYDELKKSFSECLHKARIL